MFKLIVLSAVLAVACAAPGGIIAHTATSHQSVIQHHATPVVIKSAPIVAVHAPVVHAPVVHAVPIVKTVQVVPVVKTVPIIKTVHTVPVIHTAVHAPIVHVH